MSLTVEEQVNERLTDLQVAQAKLDGKVDGLVQSVQTQITAQSATNARVDSLLLWRAEITGSLITIKTLLWAGTALAGSAAAMLSWLVFHK